MSQSPPPKRPSLACIPDSHPPLSPSQRYQRRREQQQHSPHSAPSSPPPLPWAPAAVSSSSPSSLQLGSAEAAVPGTTLPPSQGAEEDAGGRRRWRRRQQRRGSDQRAPRWQHQVEDGTQHDEGMVSRVRWWGGQRLLSASQRGELVMWGVSREEGRWQLRPLHQWLSQIGGSTTHMHAKGVWTRNTNNRLTHKKWVCLLWGRGRLSMSSARWVGCYMFVCMYM